MGYTPGGFQPQTVITSRSRQKWEKQISDVARLGLVVEVAPGAPLGLDLCATTLAKVAPNHPKEQPGPWALLFCSSDLNGPQATPGELRLPHAARGLPPRPPCFLTALASTCQFQPGIEGPDFLLSVRSMHACRRKRVTLEDTVGRSHRWHW